MTRTLIEEAAAGDAEIIGLTVDQYDYLIEHGLLDEDHNTELLDGFIVRRDRAKAGEDPVTIGDRHTLVVQRFIRMASLFDPHGTHLRVQAPIVLPPNNQPEPDVAVTMGARKTSLVESRPLPRCLRSSKSRIIRCVAIRG